VPPDMELQIRCLKQDVGTSAQRLDDEGTSSTHVVHSNAFTADDACHVACQVYQAALQQS